VAVSPSKIIEALLTTRTRSDAATKAGVSPGLIVKLLKDPNFRDMLKQAQEDHIEQGLRQFKRRLTDAVSRLAEEMDSENPNTGRIASSSKFIEHALKVLNIGNKQESVDDTQINEMIEREVQRRLNNQTTAIE